jgi:hypothetical protein
MMPTSPIASQPDSRYFANLHLPMPCLPLWTLCHVIEKTHNMKCDTPNFHRTSACTGQEFRQYHW